MSPPQPVKRRRKNSGLWSYREDDSVGQVSAWIKRRGPGGALRPIKTLRAPLFKEDVLHYSSREADGKLAFITEGKNGPLKTYNVTKYLGDVSKLTIEVIIFTETETIQCDCGHDNHGYSKPCAFAGAVMRTLGILLFHEDWIALGQKAPETTPTTLEAPKSRRTMTEAELERAGRKNKGGRPKKDPQLSPQAVRHTSATKPGLPPPATPAPMREALPSMQQTIRDGFYPVMFFEDGVWKYTVCKSIPERNELMRGHAAPKTTSPRTAEEQMPLEAIADAAWRLRDETPPTPHLVEEATTPPVKYGDAEYAKFAKRVFNAQKSWTKILREVYHHDAKVIDASWSPPGADPTAKKQAIGAWVITKLPLEVT
jgi:hypothetical protein